MTMSTKNMKKTLKFTNLVAVFLFIGASLFSNLANAQAADAENFLRKKHDDVHKFLRAKASPSRDGKLDKMLDGLLDYEALSKRSLAKEWEKHSEEERKSFVGLLKKLIRKNYRSNLQQTIDFNVAYTASEDKGQNALVHTEAASKKNRRAPKVNIDYELAKKSGNWLVVDVVTDGVSLVSNYRRQFKRIIKKKGWNGLMEKMQAKLKE